MVDELAQQSIDELQLVRGECLKLINDVKTFCPKPAEGQYPEVFRLMATPILYSAWERCFTLCHAIALRLLQRVAKTPHGLSSVQRAIWLMRTPFFASLRARLAEGLDKSPKKGQFSALCSFIAEFDAWSHCAFDHSIETDALVMTFSNVNPDVVEINAEAVGFTKVTKFSSFKFGRLHNLVDQRNGIGHGSNIEAPKQEEFEDLLDFTEKLIEHYCDCAIDWVKQQTGPATAQPAQVVQPPLPPRPTAA